MIIAGLYNYSKFHLRHYIANDASLLI